MVSMKETKSHVGQEKKKACFLFSTLFTRFGAFLLCYFSIVRMEIIIPSLQS